ncbi:MAG: hypothetical protein DBX91_06490 [Subdoligranulum variabile]|nr:MAG: hypothetical protein DBX91_06490 [Subdoligranulum variabile]
MFNTSTTIVLLLLWAIKAPFRPVLNGASPKLLFCVYFCLTSARRMEKGTSFGNALRRLRLSCGLTQQAVADALHVNRATYTYYELGKTQPDFQQLEKIAQVFGVNLETLSRILVDPESTHSWEVSVRAPKKVAPQPETLSQLTAEEKSLIALYRLCDEGGKQEIRKAARAARSWNKQR